MLPGLTNEVVLLSIIYNNTQSFVIKEQAVSSDRTSVSPRNPASDTSAFGKEHPRPLIFFSGQSPSDDAGDIVPISHGMV